MTTSAKISLKTLSRKSWECSIDSNSIDLINVGLMQRIADSLEAQNSQTQRINALETSVRILKRELSKLRKEKSNA